EPENCCDSTLWMVRSMKRPWLYDGVMTETLCGIGMSGQLLGIASGTKDCSRFQEAAERTMVVSAPAFARLERGGAAEFDSAGSAAGQLAGEGLFRSAGDAV